MKSLFAITAALLFGALVSLAPAADEKPDAKDQTIALGEKGESQLIAADNWKRVKPRSFIINHEFAVPAAEGDKEDGRLTVSGAGGSIKDNIDRWMKQFAQEDGSETKDKSKVEEKKIAGLTVHLVDIAGTFKDAPAGPFNPGGKTIDRANYRMLAAIIMSKEAGNYFIKLTGPKKTIADNEKAFWAMVEGLKVK